MNQIQLNTSDDINRISLERLVAYSRYRDHPRLTEGEQKQLLRHELAAATRHGGVFANIENNRAAAICAITPLDWDSRHFGFPMAKLTLASAPECPSSMLSHLIRTTLQETAQQAPSLHISVEIDIDDYKGLNALFGQGFEMMDIKREFRWTSLKGVTPPKFLSRVRSYQSSDKKQVMSLLSKCAFAGRFSRDPYIPSNKVTEMYAIWLSRLLDSTAHDSIALVLEKDGVVQACGVTEHVDLSSSGIPIQFMDKGLYLSSPEVVGSYYPVIYGLATHALARHDSVQTSVSLNNHSATRVLERMRGGTQTTRVALRLCMENKKELKILEDHL